MVIASCGNAMYGTTYWVRHGRTNLLSPCASSLYIQGSQLTDQNLWDFFNATLDHNWNAGARTLVFLAALTQVYATFVSLLLSTNENASLIYSGHEHQLKLHPSVSRLSPTSWVIHSPWQWLRPRWTVPAVLYHCARSDPLRHSGHLCW